MAVVSILLGPDQLTANTFRMLCVWMQDDADIFKISKLLEELPKVFFLWIEGQVSTEDNQVTRRVNYKSEALCSCTRWVSQTPTGVVPLLVTTLPYSEIAPIEVASSGHTSDIWLCPSAIIDRPSYVNQSLSQEFKTWTHIQSPEVVDVDSLQNSNAAHKRNLWGDDNVL